MQQEHVMLDLETYGVTPGSVILSVGAAYFDPLTQDEPAVTFYRNVTVESCLSLGMTVDPQTVNWWAEPERKTAWQLLASKQAPVEEVMRSFAHFFKSFGGIFVWGHGACFDVVLIEEAMRRSRVEVPWKFRNVRDTRTLFDVSGLEESMEMNNLQRDGVHHNSLDDTLFQIKCVRAAYEMLV